MNLKETVLAIKAKLKAFASFIDEEIAKAAQEALSITTAIKMALASPTGQEVESLISTFIPNGAAYAGEASAIIDSSIPMLKLAQQFGDKDALNGLLARLGKELTMLINPKATPASFQYHAFDSKAQTV